MCSSDLLDRDYTPLLLRRGARANQRFVKKRGRGGRSQVHVFAKHYYGFALSRPSTQPPILKRREVLRCVNPGIDLMTTSSHNEDMKAAKVSELKAQLSAYLSEVRRGDTVIVYDRNTPIARLVPFQEEPDDVVIVEPSAAPSSLRKIKGVRPKKRIDIDKLLRESRQGR